MGDGCISTLLVKTGIIPNSKPHAEKRNEIFLKLPLLILFKNQTGARTKNGKIGKIVPEFLAKGQVGSCTFVWANFILQLSNLGSVISLKQTTVTNTIKSANGQ